MFDQFNPEVPSLVQEPGTRNCPGTVQGPFSKLVYRSMQLTDAI